MKYLVVKGSGGGGLGDSIRVVLTAILYAKASGRVLFVDWRHGLLGDKGHNVFDDLFRLDGVEIANSIPETDSVHPPAWISRTQKSLDDIYVDDGAPPWIRAAAISKYSTDLSRIDYPHDVLFMWDFDQLHSLIPYLPEQFRCVSDTEILRNAWESHVTLVHDVQSLIDESWATCNDRPVIGAHVRMTDEYSANKGMVSLTQYKTAIARLKRKHPQAAVLLATDNVRCQQEITKSFNGVLTRPKWFNTAGDPLHLGSACPNRFQATVDALVELILLSKCDYLIRPASSSFSMVSGVIGHSHGIQEVTLRPESTLISRLIRKVRTER